MELRDGTHSFCVDSNCAGWLRMSQEKSEWQTVVYQPEISQDKRACTTLWPRSSSNRTLLQFDSSKRLPTQLGKPISASSGTYAEDAMLSRKGHLYSQRHWAGVGSAFPPRLHTARRSLASGEIRIWFPDVIFSSHQRRFSATRDVVRQWSTSASKSTWMPSTSARLHLSQLECRPASRRWRSPLFLPHQRRWRMGATDAPVVARRGPALGGGTCLCEQHLWSTRCSRGAKMEQRS